MPTAVPDNAMPWCCYAEKIKLVILGAVGCGKTSLVASYALGDCPTSESILECEPHRYYASSVTEKDKRVFLALFDTHGNIDHDRKRPLCFPGTDVFIIVYDVTDPTSFEKCREFRKEVALHMSQGDSHPMVLVGNKIDCEDQRKVLPARGRELANSWGCSFFEVSAWRQTELNEFFESITRIALKTPNTNAKWGFRSLMKQSIANADEPLSLGYDVTGATGITTNTEVANGIRERDPIDISTVTTSFSSSAAKLMKYRDYFNTNSELRRNNCTKRRNGIVETDVFENDNFHDTGIEGPGDGTVDIIVHRRVHGGHHGNSTARSQHTDSVLCLDFDTEHLYSGSADATIRKWEIKSGRAMMVMRGHVGPVVQVKAHRSRFLISASDDGTIRLWIRVSGECIQAYRGHRSAVHAFEVLNASLFSCSQDASVVEHSFRTGISACAMHTPTPLLCMVIWYCLRISCSDNNSESGVQSSHYQRSMKKPPIMSSNLVCTGGADGSVRIFDIDIGKQVRQFGGHKMAVRVLRIFHHLLYSGSDDGFVRVFRPDTGEATQVFDGHTDAVTDIALHDSTLITASADTTIRLCDINLKRTSHVLRGHTKGVSAVAVMRGYVVSAGRDCTIQCHSSVTGEPLWAFDGHSDCINCVAVAMLPRLGYFVFTASKDSTLHSWNLQKGTLHRVFAGRVTRFRSEHVPTIQGVLGVVNIVVLNFQLYGLPLTLTVVEWGYLNPLSYITNVLNFSFGDFAYAAAFWPVTTLMGLFFLVFFFLSGRIRDLKSGTWGLFIWAVAWTLCWMSTTVFFIPFLRTVLSAYSCRNGVMSVDSDIECWTGVHIIYILLGVLLLFIYIPLVMRFVLLDGDLSKVAVRFPFTWLHDRPDTRYVNMSSKRCLTPERFHAFLRFICVCAVIFGLNSPIPAITSLVVVSTIINISTFLIPPFHSTGLNCLQAGLISFVLWIDICALFSVVYPDSNIVSDIYWAIAFVVFIIAIIAMQRRIWILGRVRGSNKHEGMLPLIATSHRNSLESENGNQDTNEKSFPTKARSMFRGSVRSISKSQPELRVHDMMDIVVAPRVDKSVSAPYLNISSYNPAVNTLFDTVGAAATVREAVNPESDVSVSESLHVMRSSDTNLHPLAPIEGISPILTRSINSLEQENTFTQSLSRLSPVLSTTNSSIPYIGEALTPLHRSGEFSHNYAEALIIAEQRTREQRQAHALMQSEHAVELIEESFTSSKVTGVRTSFNSEDLTPYAVAIALEAESTVPHSVNPLLDTMTGPLPDWATGTSSKRRSFLSGELKVDLDDSLEEDSVTVAFNEYIGKMHTERLTKTTASEANMSISHIEVSNDSDLSHHLRTSRNYPQLLSRVRNPSALTDALSYGIEDLESAPSNKLGRES